MEEKVEKKAGEEFLEEHKKDKETADDGEIINNCSIGMNAIINYLAKEMPNVDKNRYSNVLINVETLIRNNYNKENKRDDWLKAVNQDINIFMEYMNEYCKYNSKKTVVVFYTPIYKFSDNYAIQTKSVQWHAVMEFKNYLYRKASVAAHSEYSDKVDYAICTLSDDGFRIPKGIIKLLESYGGNTNGKTLMISSAPVDFHVARSIRDFHLLESYTAELKEPTEFGKKVFKSNSIPFNQYTHVALGDKNHLKKQVKGGKISKRLEEQAKAEKWWRLTETKILSKLSMYISHDILLKGRFY